MLDDVFEAGTNTALTDLARRPIAQPEPTANFSFWRTVGAGLGGVATGGVTDPLAFGAEVTGAMGDMTRAFGTAGSPLMLEGVDPVQMDLDTNRESRRRVETRESFSNPVGDAVRQAARDHLMPDPVTSHTAEQVMFGFAKYGTKAVGYSLLAGPAGGALLTGLDEGMATSDELRQKGVDPSTRTSVGTLAGVAAGLGVALPVSGAGVKSTVALTAAGGPGAFMAQQAVTRSILENAGYDKLASQYDPFDPVGLALSTLVPAGFGAFALRGRARAARAAEAGRSPEPTAKPEAVAAHDPELVDAARVQQVRDIVDSWNLGNKADIEAANQSLMAFTRASDQMAAGERVAINDLVPLEKAASAKAIDEMITRFEAARADLAAQTGDLADPGAVRTMRTELDALRQAGPDTSDAGLRAIAKDIQAREGVSYKRALSDATRQMADIEADHAARITRLEDAIERNADANRAQQALGVVDEQLTRARSARESIDAPATKLKPVAAAVRELGKPGMTAGADQPRPGAKPAAQAARAAPEAPPAAGGGRKAENSEEGDGDAQAQARVIELAATNPDLMVHLEGKDEPMRLADALEQIQREAAQDAADAPLLQVAANCFLSL